MPHINLPENVYGIRSLALFRPETGKALYDLAEVLLRSPSTLSSAERELIAAFVSYKNSCTYCYSSHAAASRYLYKDEKQTVDLVLSDYQNAPISQKLKALLTIASKVQGDARTVASEDIKEARLHGADDKAIHDTVLIAAAFCMFNRYVDGLATLTPSFDDRDVWQAMGERMGSVGYVMPEKK